VAADVKSITKVSLLLFKIFLLLTSPVLLVLFLCNAHMIKLQHFGHIFLEKMEQVEETFAFEVQLLLDLNISVQYLSSNVVVQNLNACVDKAL
jgi:hypothetical protein